MKHKSENNVISMWIFLCKTTLYASGCSNSAINIVFVIWILKKCILQLKINNIKEECVKVKEFKIFTKHSSNTSVNISNYKNINSIYYTIKLVKKFKKIITKM